MRPPQGYRTWLDLVDDVAFGVAVGTTGVLGASFVVNVERRAALVVVIMNAAAWMWIIHRA